MPKFPFTNYHELNLDWILKKVNALFDASEENARTIRTYDTRLTRAEQTATNAETAATSAQQLADAAAANADNALSVAGTADAKANSALTAATNAAGAASGALTVAQEARQIAGNAQSAAADAGALANDASNAAAAAQQTADTNAGNITALQNNITDKLNDKADIIIDSTSGTIASFSDGADNMPIKSLVANIEPVQDLHGYANPWPAGGGANICDPLLKFTAGTYYGIALSTNDGYQFSISETATGSGNISCPTIPTADAVVYPAGTYTSTGAIFATYKPDGSWYTNRQVGTWTADSDFIVRSAYIQIVEGTSPTSELRFLSLTKGSTALTTWTPYENICPITGHMGCSVVRTGSNLLDVNTNVIDRAIGVTGNIVSSTGSRGGQYTQLIRVNKGELYVFSAVSEDDGQWTRRLHGYDNNGEWVRQLGTAGANAAIPSGTTFSISVIIPDDVSYVRVSYMKKDTEGKVLNTLELTVSWQSEAGTVYGGTLDVVSGVLNVNTKMITLNGSENWVTYTGGSAGAYAMTLTLPDLKQVNTSNYLTAISRDETWGNFDSFVSFAINPQRLVTGIRTITTLADWKNYLAQNPLQVVYTVESVIYQLTPQQINTLLGTNNIWTDVGTVDVEYPADTKLYIDGKIAELQALVLEN